MSILAASDKATVRLHDATTPREFAPALFAFMAQALVQETMVLTMRPLEFELPAYSSRPEFQPVCDDHIAGGHTDDIWLQRSPIRPDIPVVRHSLYTPKAMFRASKFYKVWIRRRSAMKRM